MTSLSPVYPQPATPYVPAPTTQQPFQQSASTPYYTVTEQTPVEIRPQPNQPLQLQPLSAYHEVPTTGQLPGAPMTSLSPVYPQPATPYVPAPTTQQPFQQSAQQSASTPYYTVTEQTPVGIRPQPNQPLQLQPLSAYHEVPTTGQLPGAPMTSLSPVYPQPATPYVPAPTTQQPFQQSASTPYYTVTEQTPVEIRPQPNQPLQLQPLSAYHEVPTTGQLPGAPMTSHSPMYPQPATPYVPAPTTQQPFQQSASTPYYTVTEQTPVGIRLQPGQPLQLQPLSAYHEVPTTGQLPGAPMTSHFPVNPYAPQLLVYGQPQPKWQPVYQQPYENQSTISSEPRANYSFSSNTQLSEMP